MVDKNSLSGGNFANQMINLVASLKIFDSFTKKASTSFNNLKNELDKTVGMERAFTKGGAAVFRKSPTDLFKYRGGFGTKSGGNVSSNVASSVMSGSEPGLFGQFVGSFANMTSNFANLAISPFKRIGLGLKNFSAGFGGEKTVGLMGRMGNKIGSFASGLTKIPQKALGQMAGSFGQMAMVGLASGGMMMLVQIAMQLLAALNPFQPLMEALTTIFGVYGAILEQAFTPLIEKLFEVMLSPSVISMFEALTSAVLQIVIAFFPLIDILTPFATLFMMALILPLQILAPLINLLAIPLGWLANAFMGVNAGLQTIFNGWNTYIAPIGAGLSAFFNLIAQGWNSFAGFITGIPQWFKDTLINPFIGFLNTISTSINSWDSLGWFPDLKTIPYMAKGGIVTQPTIAMIGEAGPEAVVPLSGPNKGNMGVTINVYGEVTEEKLYRMQRDAWLNNL